MTKQIAITPKSEVEEVIETLEASYNRILDIISSEKANAEEIEKLSGALAHLDMIDRFDMSKIYEALNNKDGTLAIGVEK